MSEPKRYHLLKQRNPKVYYVIDIENDYWGAMSYGKISRMDTEDIIQADTLSDMLMLLREDESTIWYGVTDWLGNDGVYRHDEYPYFQSIHPLRGYIKDVCEIRFDDRPYLRDWVYDYISQIWVKEDEYHFIQVQDYEKKITEIVKEMAEKRKAEQIKEQKDG